MCQLEKEELSVDPLTCRHTFVLAYDVMIQIHLLYSFVIFLKLLEDQSFDNYSQAQFVHNTNHHQGLYASSFHRE